MTSGMTERSILSVTQLNTYVKMLLDSDEVLQYLWVRGEISNFKLHAASGHLYFSLKDADGCISCVMFRSSAVGLAFRPQDGMKVLLRGRVSMFPRTGQYQMYAEEMQPDGLGTLYLAFEQLKRKLAEEGLFDPERKRPIPPYPQRIGIITSATGAAIHDMMTVTGRRYPAAQLVLYPCQVQGPEAPGQLTEAVKTFNRMGNVDVILIGRGGGSMEDLWAFNNETLARAVAASQIPVISAVGHESDYTICDFVADLRAATPSAAAELAVPDRGELMRGLETARIRMTRALDAQIADKRQSLSRIAQSRAMASPLNLIQDRRMNVAFLSERADRLAQAKLTAVRSAMAEFCAKLDALSPVAVLARGYTMVQDEKGQVVTSAKHLSAGDCITLRFEDGQKQAEILS